MPATKPTTSAQQNAKHTKVDFKKTLQSNFLNPSMQSSTHTFERFVPIQSHLNLLNYTHWSRLNTLYFTQVFSFSLTFNSDSLAFAGIFTFLSLIIGNLCVAGTSYQPQLPRGAAGDPRGQILRARPAQYSFRESADSSTRCSCSNCRNTETYLVCSKWRQET